MNGIAIYGSVEPEVERKGKGDPWRAVFAASLDEVVGTEARRRVLPDEANKAYPCDPVGNVRWTSAVIDRMEDLVGRDDSIEGLSRCAHILPDSTIEKLREVYERHHDLEELREFWQERFIRELKDLHDPMSQEWLSKVVGENWGQVGRREGNVIIATKIPENMKGYFEASDENERRYHYCHCDRIRAVHRTGRFEISPTYYYCGGGFYKSNWERILGRRVKVELLKCLLKGDDVCQFAIQLPEGV